MEEMHGLMNYRLHIEFKSILYENIDNSLEEVAWDRLRDLFRDRLNRQFVRQLEVQINNQLKREGL